jgi:hypothetical protein
MVAIIAVSAVPSCLAAKTITTDSYAEQAMYISPVYRESGTRIIIKLTINMVYTATRGPPCREARTRRPWPRYARRDTPSSPQVVRL